MRRLIVVFAALSIAAPLLAQGAPAASDPQDDLRCAAWAAETIGANKDNPDAVKSLTSALMLFLGRYEAETGKRFEESLTVDYLNRVGPEVANADAHCRARIKDMGQRLVDWGHALQAKAAQAAGKPAPK